MNLVGLTSYILGIISVLIGFISLIINISKNKTAFTTSVVAILTSGVVLIGFGIGIKLYSNNKGESYAANNTIANVQQSGNSNASSPLINNTQDNIQQNIGSNSSSSPKSVTQTMLIENPVYGFTYGTCNYFVVYPNIYIYDKNISNKPLLLGSALDSEANNKIAVLDNYMYFIDACGHMCKLALGDLNYKHVVTLNKEKSIGCFVLDKNYIYYRSFDGFANIHRMNIDGTNDILLSNDIPWELYIDKDWLYYVNKDDADNIYKIKIDGTSRTKLTSFTNTETSSSSSRSICVEGDYLYFIHTLNNEVGKYVSICKVKINGISYSMIDKDKAESICVYNGRIYYVENIGGSNNLLSIKVDGSDKKSSALTELLYLSMYNGIISAVQNGGSGFYIYDISTDILRTIDLQM